ncbi:MAG: tetratricopeptide repeat protein, partial [Limisphaerales bacterium]
EGVHLLRTRARVHARRGRFEAAADDFRKLLELEPGNHFDYLQLAPLLLEIGDEAGYLELYRRMVGTFLDTPDPNVANRVAKAGLLMPIPNVDQAPLDRWTGFALRELETHMFLPYAQHARGLFVLRQGRYSEAVEWMEKVLGNTGPSKAGLRDAQACAVLAMAQARLGALDEARESVRRAIEIRDSDPNADPEDLLSSWHDWLITELHIREAEAVIKECDAG